MANAEQGAPRLTLATERPALTEVGGRKSYRDVKHYKRRKRWLS